MAPVGASALCPFHCFETYWVWLNYRKDIQLIKFNNPTRSFHNRRREPGRKPADPGLPEKWLLRTGCSMSRLTHGFANQRLTLTLRLTLHALFHASVTRDYVTH